MKTDTKARGCGPDINHVISQELPHTTERKMTTTDQKAAGIYFYMFVSNTGMYVFVYI